MNRGRADVVLAAVGAVALGDAAADPLQRSDRDSHPGDGCRFDGSTVPTWLVVDRDGTMVTEWRTT